MYPKMKDFDKQNKSLPEGKFPLLYFVLGLYFCIKHILINLKSMTNVTPSVYIQNILRELGLAIFQNVYSVVALENITLLLITYNLCYAAFTPSAICYECHD